MRAHGRRRPLTDFRGRIRPDAQRFCSTLRNTHATFVLRYGGTSPSGNIVHSSFSPTHVTTVCGRCTSTVSILASRGCFRKDFSFLPVIDRVTPRPVLYGSFVVSPCRVCLTHCCRTSTYLLVLSMLSSRRCHRLTTITRDLRVNILARIDGRRRLRHTVTLKTGIINVGGHSLHSLSVSLGHAHRLTPGLKRGIAMVDRSNVGACTRIHRLDRFTGNFLVNSTLVTRSSLRTTIHQILLNRGGMYNLAHKRSTGTTCSTNTVCNKLVFITASPHYIGIRRTRRIVTTTPLRCINIFHGRSVTSIISGTGILSLTTIRLRNGRRRLCVSALHRTLPTRITV